MTIQAWKAETASRLREAGISSTAELDTRLLLEFATGYDHVRQLTHPEHQLSEEELAQLDALRADRLRHKPMAYILGYKEFYGRPFIVDDHVLIPRPDTETLIEAVLSYAADGHPSILDVCTGSGCIGITLALELNCEATLSDISTAALAIADRNARNLLGRPLRLLEGDLLCPADRIYDIIVSNPPYLTSTWCEEVSDEVKWEPRLALEGFAQDGLALIRRLLEQSLDHLARPGALFLECDYRQADDVALLMQKSGFTEVKIEYDLAGRKRVVWGVLACTNS